MGGGLASRGLSPVAVGAGDGQALCWQLGRAMVLPSSLFAAEGC